MPIGNSDHFYQGTFDGDGKCVTNLNIDTNDETDLGFFGCVQDATINNLYVQGNITCNSSYNIGGIVGYAKSSDGNFVKISNCINNVEIININSSSSVGGILGNFYLGEITIDSCVNIANLTAPYPSGILNTSGNSKIKNCLNLGNLNSNSTVNKRTAGICMTDSVNCTVSNCINTGNITPNNSVYPILRYTKSVPEIPMCSECYYDSNILPTVTDVPCVEGIPSSDFDTLSLEGWDDPVSESQYPIPTAIKNTFEENTSCWEDIILEAAKITEATAGYVSGAYYVNETGNDTNDGSSIDFPKKNLTNVITSLKGKDVRTIYIDGELTAESQGVTEISKNTLVIIKDKEFGEDNKITLIGIHDATIDAQNYGRFIETDANFYMKMQNLTIINGQTSSSGGALFFYKSSLELDGCVIKDCVSTYDQQKYTGIYMSGSGSVLKMTNTTCENSIYLYVTTATIGSNCTIGTSDTTATDGFITLDESTLILNGKNIDINKPIYVKNRTSSIQIGNDYSHGEPITIKLASGITKNYDNLNPYTLITNYDVDLCTYFNIECEDPEMEATLDTNGNITVN